LYGRKAGILSSILAVASFDFFFVPPFYTFNVADVRFIPTFLVLFIVGIITSLLADTVKRQVAYTRQREQFISTLYDLSRDLLTSQDLDEILERSTKYISESFNYDVIILLPDDNYDLMVKSRFGNNVKFDDHDIGVSNWVFEYKKSAGYGTDTLSSSEWHQVPLKVQKRALGVLAIAPKDKMNNEKKHLVESFARVVSLALSHLNNK